MYNETIKQLEEMSRIATASSKTLESQMNVLGDTMGELLKTVPDDQKAEIEGAQSLMTSVINSAKSGKFEKANELIKNFENGRKNSK